jgi:hypothetical protein
MLWNATFSTESQISLSDDTLKVMSQLRDTISEEIALKHEV